MKEEVLEMIGKVKEAKTSVAVVDGVTVFLRIRSGHMEGEKDWIVEASVFGDNDWGVVSRGFDSKSEALVEYSKLKEEFGARESE